MTHLIMKPKIMKRRILKMSNIYNGYGRYLYDEGQKKESEEEKNKHLKEEKERDRKSTRLNSSH